MRRLPSDHGVATLAWLASIVMFAIPTHPWLQQVQFGILIATTANLLQARHILYHAGDEFVRRVTAVLADDIARFEHRMGECERKVEDVKQAQINIAGQFRGRQHP